MYKADIKSFLFALGVKGVRSSDDWVNSSCPMASISHSKGVDKHPSFGISVNPQGESVYQCFTCSEAAPLSGLVHNLWIKDIPGWREAMRIYGETEIFRSEDNEHISSWDDKKIDISTKLKPEPIPKYILDKYPLIEQAIGFESKRCREYLRDVRGIDKETQDIFRLRHSIQDRAIVFPRIGKDWFVWWLRARSRMEKAFFTPVFLKIAEEWGDSSHFFGEQFLTNDPVILVESATDVLKLYTFGIYNVVATEGIVQKSQLDRLCNSVTLLGFDADLPGLKNKIKAERHLKGRTALFNLDWGKANVNDAGALESKADFDKVYNAKILL